MSEFKKKNIINNLLRLAPLIILFIAVLNEINLNYIILPLEIILRNILYNQIITNKSNDCKNRDSINNVYIINSSAFLKSTLL